MTRRLSWVVLMSLPLWGRPSAGLAASVRIDFAGVISTSSPNFLGGSLEGSPFATVGSPFAGYFAFDTDLATELPGHVFRLDGAILHVESGAHSIDAGPPGFVVIEDNDLAGADRWWSDVGPILLDSVELPLDARLTFEDASATRISSTSFFLPTSLDGWTRTDFSITTSKAVVVSAGGLTQWSVTAPEPQSLALLAAVLAILSAGTRGAAAGRR